MDTPRPSLRTDWTRRVLHPVLIGHGGWGAGQPASRPRSRSAPRTSRSARPSSCRCPRMRSRSAKAPRRWRTPRPPPTPPHTRKMRDSASNYIQHGRLQKAYEESLFQLLVAVGSPQDHEDHRRTNFASKGSPRPASLYTKNVYPSVKCINPTLR